ncbi:MAG: tetratricopeptide repeat protein, partial [Candidatus Krumholzibacteria bacterium]|nr:tetratricopeptide repeat protein [Candidatus Krumholzibacteria bacterium]
IDPIFSDASFNLAVTYQKLGLHRNAAAVLEDLMSRFPDNPGYLFALGHSLYHIGDLGGARETFSDVLSIDPGHLKALFSLAVVCEKMGREDEARRMWVEYLELDPKGEWAVEARSHLESLLRSDRR